jgi:hypothetical protein
MLVKNFRDKRPITNISDDRIQQNHDLMHWFIKWENSVKSDEKIKNKEKHLISYQTREDIVSLIPFAFVAVLYVSLVVHHHHHRH